MMYLAGKPPPPVRTASPAGHSPRMARIARHSSRINGPPARWIAPSTPPPPRSVEFAAFTIASTLWRVMSPRTSSITFPEMVFSMRHIIRSNRADGMREAFRRALRRHPPLRRLLRDLAQAVQGAGGAVYLVGGFLRNIVEGREPGDVDLLVTGLSYRRTGDVLRSLSVKTPGIRKVVAAGRHFPVHRIAVDWGKEYIDISNARAGGRPRPPLPETTPADDDREAVDDVARRDFTMNGLLFRLAPGRTVDDGRLLDPFGGIEDVRGKRI